MKKLVNTCLKPLMCSAFLLLGACSSGLDPRPEVDTSQLGTVFFAEVRSVFVARDRGFGRSFYENVPSSFFNERAALQSDLRRASQLRVLGSLARAVTGDVEARFGRLKCVYIVKSDDERIQRYVNQSVLSDFGSENTTIFLPGPSSGFPGPGGYDPRDPFSYPNGDTASQSKIREHFSLAQSCNYALSPGQRVVLSLTSNGTTIHELSPEMKELDRLIREEEAQRAEDFETPPKFVGLPLK